MLFKDIQVLVLVDDDVGEVTEVLCQGIVPEVVEGQGHDLANCPYRPSMARWWIIQRMTSEPRTACPTGRQPRQDDR